jgi:ubiquinone biosynthesis protein UbiJ
LNLLSPLALQAINHLLGQNPGAREGLSRHAGKTVRLDGRLFTLDVAISSDGSLVEGASVAPDATIRLDPKLLLGLPISGRAAFKTLDSEGDAGLLAELNRVFQTLEWDSEADLAPLVGDMAAHRIAAGAQALHAWARENRASALATLAEYLTEEQAVLANRPQTEQFYRDVDTLKDDAARLEARLRRLEQGS